MSRSIRRRTLRSPLAPEVERGTYCATAAVWEEEFLVAQVATRTRGGFLVLNENAEIEEETNNRNEKELLGEGGRRNKTDRFVFHTE